MIKGQARAFMMPWESASSAARGMSMQPPHTKLVRGRSENAISSGRW